MNNLYGLAMSEYLPYERFEWLSVKSVSSPENAHLNRVNGTSKPCECCCCQGCILKKKIIKDEKICTDCNECSK